MERYSKQGNSTCQVPDVRKAGHDQGTEAPRVTGAQRARAARAMTAPNDTGDSSKPAPVVVLMGLHFMERKE